MSRALWSDLFAASAEGAVPHLHVGQSAARVGACYGGRQPVYLATPYSREVVDADGHWQSPLNHRARARAARASADLMAAGVTALSPIVLSASMVEATGTVRHVKGAVRWSHGVDPLDHDAWMAWCAPLLNVCGAVVVPDIAGWQDSRGIYVEVIAALDWIAPVFVYARCVCDEVDLSQPVAGWGADA